MKQRPSWKSTSAIRNSPPFWGARNSIPCSQGQLLDSILNQLNPFLTFITFHFNIIFPHISNPLNNLYPSCYPTNVHFPFFHSCYTSCPSHNLFANPSDISWIVQQITSSVSVSVKKCRTTTYGSWLTLRFMTLQRALYWKRQVTSQIVWIRTWTTSEVQNICREM